MQQQDRWKNLLPIVVVYTIILFFYLRYVAPKGQPTPGENQSLLVQAQSLEAEGRTDNPNVALADRVKKLEQAVGKYEDFYKENQHSPEGLKARFQEVNIYDYLAKLDGAHPDVKWYDQAETKLKDMQSAFKGKVGTVGLEIHGEKVTRSGDLGAIATERLNDIRADRDAVNRGKLLYQILDKLVALTGRNPNYSYFLALAFAVILLKVVTFPFQKKQYQYQKDMARVQPLIKQMQEEMKGRPSDEISRRQMEIFKENNVNLAGGCLPMLVMMFVLWPVYYMVRQYEYQFSHAHFLWVGSPLAQKYWWIAGNLAQFDLPLFVIYLLTTIAYSALQPKPADPQQAQQQKMMTYMMPVMFGAFMWMYKWSSAFMLYWLILNLVSMYQSWRLNKEFGSAPGGATASGPNEPPKPSAPLPPMSGNGGSKRSGKRSGTPGAASATGRIQPRGSGGRR